MLEKYFLMFSNEFTLKWNPKTWLGNASTNGIFPFRKPNRKRLLLLLLERQETVNLSYWLALKIRTYNEMFQVRFVPLLQRFQLDYVCTPIGARIGEHYGGALVTHYHICYLHFQAQFSGKTGVRSVLGSFSTGGGAFSIKLHTCFFASFVAEEPLSAFFHCINSARHSGQRFRLMLITLSVRFLW